MSSEGDSAGGRSVAELEVRAEQTGGWSVRRADGARTLSRHATREQAERAAMLHADDRIEGELRQRIFANDPERAVRSRRSVTVVAFVGAALSIAAVAIALVLLLG